MSNLKYVDTHCHLDNPQYDMDREEVFHSLKDKMEFIVNIGYDLDSSKRSLEFSKLHENVYGTVGIHPIDIEDEFSAELKEKLEKLARDKACVAVGEIGLDYHWMTKSKEIQEMWFREQLEIAKKVNKPVVIHTRDAMEDTIRIIKDYPEIKGIFHSYPGSYESAKEIGDNFYFGIGGVLTFKNARKTVEFVEKIPLDRLVIETDSPYLTPEPNRGKRNTPLYVEYVVKKIAEIKGIDVEEVVKVTTENAKIVYGIK